MVATWVVTVSPVLMREHDIIWVIHHFCFAIKLYESDVIFMGPVGDDFPLGDVGIFFPSVV